MHENIPPDIRFGFELHQIPLPKTNPLTFMLKIFKQLLNKINPFKKKTKYELPCYME